MELYLAVQNVEEEMEDLEGAKMFRPSQQAPRESSKATQAQAQLVHSTSGQSPPSSSTDLGGGDAFQSQASTLPRSPSATSGTSATSSTGESQDGANQDDDNDEPTIHTHHSQVGNHGEEIEEIVQLFLDYVVLGQLNRSNGMRSQDKNFLNLKGAQTLGSSAQTTAVELLHGGHSHSQHNEEAEIEDAKQPEFEQADTSVADLKTKILSFKDLEDQTGTQSAFPREDVQKIQNLPTLRQNQVQGLFGDYSGDASGNCPSLMQRMSEQEQQKIESISCNRSETLFIYNLLLLFEANPIVQEEFFLKLTLEETPSEIASYNLKNKHNSFRYNFGANKNQLQSPELVPMVVESHERKEPPVGFWFRHIIAQFGVQGSGDNNTNNHKKDAKGKNEKTASQPVSSSVSELQFQGVHPFQNLQVTFQDPRNPENTMSLLKTIGDLDSDALYSHVIVRSIIKYKWEKFASRFVLIDGFFYMIMLIPAMYLAWFLKQPGATFSLDIFSNPKPLELTPAAPSTNTTAGAEASPNLTKPQFHMPFIQFVLILLVWSHGYQRSIWIEFWQNKYGRSSESVVRLGYLNLMIPYLSFLSRPNKSRNGASQKAQSRRKQNSGFQVKWLTISIPFYYLEVQSMEQCWQLLDTCQNLLGVMLLLLYIYLCLFTNTYGEGSKSEGSFKPQDEHDGYGFFYGGYEYSKSGQRRLASQSSQQHSSQQNFSNSSSGYYMSSSNGVSSTEPQDFITYGEKTKRFLSIPHYHKGNTPENQDDPLFKATLPSSLDQLATSDIAVLSALYNHFHRQLALSIVLRWLGLLYYLQGFSNTGPLIRTIIITIWDMRSFMKVMLIGWVAVSCVFYAILDMKQLWTYNIDKHPEWNVPENATIYDNTYPWYGDPQITWQFVWDMFLITYRFMTTDDESIKELLIEETSEPMRNFLQVFKVQQCMFMVIILLNMLIAIMGGSYQQICERQFVELQRLRQSIILEHELLFGEDEFSNRDWFPRYLHILIPQSAAKEPCHASEDTKQVGFVVNEMAEKVQLLAEKMDQLEAGGGDQQNSDQQNQNDQLNRKMSNLEAKLDLLLEKLNQEKEKKE